MTNPSRQKMLGQYFSGNKIANALYDLLGKPIDSVVIDPMCGKGDLLIPFSKSNNIHGVELDPSAFLLAQECLPNGARIINGNAFDASLYSNIDSSGYDIVITNPPFIRRETYQKSQEMVEGTMPITTVINNLVELIEYFDTLNQNQKERVKNVLNNVSGLSDIALLSWLLCMILTKVEGYIALVVPNTLLSREYSTSVIDVFKELYEIDYIINDVNSAWFEGSAQIQTSLIVAKRTNYVSKSHNINIVDLYRTSIGRNSIASFLKQRQTLKGFIKRGKDIEGFCEITKICQSNYASTTLLLQPTSKLNAIVKSRHLAFRTLEESGVICGQGFRSGANAFFILDNDGEYCVSKIKNIRIKRNLIYFKPIIQNQRSLGDNYCIESESETSSLLVIPKGYASTEDVISRSHEYFCILSPVPKDIQSYINIASNEKIGNNKIPELSAVKTNVKNKDGNISFWYNLPPFTQRHNAQVFVPRVNGGEVIARYNPNKYIVDANFITFWENEYAEESGLDYAALIALLNSSWINVLCEENGIVMGGGALKLDSVQIQKFPIPFFSKSDVLQLSEFGRKLISSSISSSKQTINEIDRLIVKYLCEEEYIEEKAHELQQIKVSYQQKRSK